MDEIFCKILISIGLGFLIGLEREIQGKDIGIRTVSLITLGSTLFAVMSISLMNADSSRIIAQVVSGISFVCAGVIIKDGDKIRGLTTSACLWTSAAIGCLVGISMFKEAFVGSIAIIFINILFTQFKKVTNEHGRISKYRKNS